MENKISLFLVATPIGNLSDMSKRAIDILKCVDFIGAEDTRKTGILLKYFDITTPMISYHEHNERERGAGIVERLISGEVCAIVTDAGMPAISDPGEVLVKMCHEKGLSVSVVPGPCAAMSALSVSGLSTKKFCFEGFIEPKRRQKQLALRAKETSTMIFYEAPHKLKATLIAMLDAFGNRRISLVRELTKIYENIFLTTISAAIEFYNVNEPRGEYVLVVEGYVPEAGIIDESDIQEAFFDLINAGKTKSEAAKIVANLFGMKKNEIYDKFK